MVNDKTFLLIQGIGPLKNHGEGNFEITLQKEDWLTDKGDDFFYVLKGAKVKKVDIPRNMIGRELD